MNYYEIYDRYSGELLTRGNAAECRKALGCASLDSFYALANRARRGINKKYRVVIKKGGQVDYEAAARQYNDCIRTGQIAQAVEWLTEMAEILESEKRYTDALKLGMLTFYFATSGVYAEPVIEDHLAKQVCRVVWETGLTLHEREELFLDTIRDDTLPEHIMSAKDCAYIFDVCAAGRVEDAREMLGRFVTAQAAK